RLARDEEAAPVECQLRDPRRGRLEARLARVGVDQRLRQQAGAASARLAVGPVDRGEDLAAPLALADERAKHALALWRRDADEVAVGDATRLGVERVDLDHRLAPVLRQLRRETRAGHR